MKQRVRTETRARDRDMLRPEYDFSCAIRGVTAARYAKGANVVVIDPEVLDVFPDGPSVNTIGRSRRERVLFVAHAAREGRVRIISARPPGAATI